MRGFYLHNMIQLPPTKIRGVTRPFVEVTVTANMFLDMAKKVLCFSGISTRDR